MLVGCEWLLSYALGRYRRAGPGDMNNNSADSGSLTLWVLYCSCATILLPLRCCRQPRYAHDISGAQALQGAGYNIFHRTSAITNLH